MKLPIIVNEAGKIYIEAVPPLAWGRGRECTFIGALESALAITPAPYIYEDLMGWSALAFRVRWYHGDTGRRWCPSGPVGEGQEVLVALQQATGFELPAESRSNLADRSMVDFAPRIAAEIRAGRPVLAYEPQLNMGTVFGFEEEGETLLLRDYMTEEPVRRLPIEMLGPFVCFLGQRTIAASPLDSLLAGIRRGVDSWHRSHEPARLGRYWLGRAALLKWRDDLQHVENLSPTERQLLFFVNWWTFDCLADARAAAYRFLRRNHELLPGGPHHHLVEAATLYADEARWMRAVLNEQLAFLGPWTGKNGDHWSPAVRERETAVLDRLLTLEADAMGELGNLLEAAGGAAQPSAVPAPVTP